MRAKSNYASTTRYISPEPNLMIAGLAWHTSWSQSLLGCDPSGEIKRRASLRGVGVCVLSVNED